MRRLVIVPARGGSKRLPGKNKRLLNGKPLIFHTIDAVKGLFDIVIFTSDADDLLDLVNKKYGGEIVIDKRPSNLAGDTSKVIDTVDFYANKYSDEFDQIWLTLPTCPMRTRQHIKEAQNELYEDFDSIISVTDFEFPPTLGLLVDEDNVLTEYGDANFANGNSRSQDHPRIYRPNGALYGAWREAFTKHKNFYRGKVKAYYMPRIESIDIDNEMDFKWAEYVLKQNDLS